MTRNLHNHQHCTFQGPKFIKSSWANSPTFFFGQQRAYFTDNLKFEQTSFKQCFAATERNDAKLFFSKSLTRNLFFLCWRSTLKSEKIFVLGVKAFFQRLVEKAFQCTKIGHNID